MILQIVTSKVNRLIIAQSVSICLFHLDVFTAMISSETSLHQKTCKFLVFEEFLFGH